MRSTSPEAGLVPGNHRGDNPYVGPCACDRTGSASTGGGDCGPKLLLSHEEAAILASMRTIHQEVVALRTELRRIESRDGQTSSRRMYLEATIQLYRRQFNRHREALERANRVKHIRLGHLDPDGE